MRHCVLSALSCTTFGLTLIASSTVSAGDKHRGVVYYPASSPVVYPSYPAQPMAYAPQHVTSYVPMASSTYSVSAPAYSAPNPTVVTVQPQVVGSAPRATSNAPVNASAPADSPVQLSETLRWALVEGLVEFYRKTDGSGEDGTARNTKLDKIKALRDEAIKRYAGLVSRKKSDDSTEDAASETLDAADQREVDLIVDRVLATVQNESNRYGYSPSPDYAWGASPGPLNWQYPYPPGPLNWQYPYPGPTPAYRPTTPAYAPPAYAPAYGGAQPLYLVPLQPVAKKHFWHR